LTPTPAIDVHAHYFPDAYLRAIEEAGAAFGAVLDRSNPAGPAIRLGGAPAPVLEARFRDLGPRLASMNRQGVGVQALSLTVPMVYWASGEVGARLSQVFNDAASQAHVAHPDRFVSCAMLPLQEPALALAELARAARLPGTRAVYMGTNVNGRELSDPAFFPVFERCQALGLPVLLHPVSVVGAARLRPYYLSNLLGNPFDTAIAAAHLVFGGVLDRLPRLHVGLPHAGGAFPYLVGRLRRGQQVRSEIRGAARRAVSAYLRRFSYDTISHDPAALRHLIAIVGVDRVMLGSDFCFDMGYERPRAIVVAKALGLGRRDQERILRGNAARLLGIQ